MSDLSIYTDSKQKLTQANYSEFLAVQSKLNLNSSTNKLQKVNVNEFEWQELSFSGKASIKTGKKIIENTAAMITQCKILYSICE